MEHSCLNFSKLSKEVQEAIRTCNLFSNALERARAGETWLDTHAPLYWRLAMISAHDGHISCHVQMHVDIENPLALAFRGDPRFPERPTWADVQKKFFEGARIHEAELLGFVEKTTRVGDMVIPSDVDAYYLNAAWEEVTGNFSYHTLMSQIARATVRN